MDSESGNPRRLAVLRYRVDAGRNPKPRPVRDLVDRQIIANGRIHFGTADMNNLPTSSGFTSLAMEGDLRAVSTA